MTVFTKNEGNLKAKRRIYLLCPRIFSYKTVLIEKSDVVSDVTAEVTADVTADVKTDKDTQKQEVIVRKNCDTADVTADVTAEVTATYNNKKNKKKEEIYSAIDIAGRTHTLFEGKEKGSLFSASALSSSTPSLDFSLQYA